MTNGDTKRIVLLAADINTSPHDRVFFTISEGFDLNSTPYISHLLQWSMIHSYFSLSMSNCSKDFYKLLEHALQCAHL